MDEENTKVSLPVSTKDLLEVLSELYPVSELLTLVRSGDEKQIERYVGKLELIEELTELYREQEAYMKVDRAKKKS